MRGVHENPRIVKSPASDADPGDSSFLQHHPRGLGSSHISIADDRSGLDGLRDGANAIQIYPPSETLLAGAPMHENSRHPDPFQGPSQIRRGDVLIIPA